MSEPLVSDTSLIARALLAVGLPARWTAFNVARLVLALATEDCGLPQIAASFAQAVAATEAASSVAALAPALEALAALRSDAGVPWTADAARNLVR